MEGFGKNEHRSVPMEGISSFTGFPMLQVKFKWRTDVPLTDVPLTRHTLELSPRGECEPPAFRQRSRRKEAW